MAQHRHKRETHARRFLGNRLTQLRAATLAAPLAAVATAGVVSIGVLGAEVAPGGVAAPEPVVGDSLATAVSVSDRLPTLSRGRADRGEARAERQGKTARVEPGRRVSGRTAVTVREEPSPAEKRIDALLEPQAVREAIDQAETRLWTTTELNLWTGPGEDATQTGVLGGGEEVLVTGRSAEGRVEIVWERDETRWVTEGYLSEEEPFSLGGDCSNGTSVPSGVSENIKKVHEAVCAEFPEITTYGTFRSDGEHAQGIAVDIMVSGDRGWQVAEFVRKYYAELGVNYIIYSQQIWSVERSGEGWRGMEDRGSTTANHYDHVHVTTY